MAKKLEYLTLHLDKPNRFSQYVIDYIIRGNEIQERRSLSHLAYSSVPISDAIKAITSASKGLQDVSLNIETERGYDDDYTVVITVAGFRAQTEDEVKKISIARSQMKAKELKRTEFQEEKDKAEFERLSKKYKK